MRKGLALMHKPLHILETGGIQVNVWSNRLRERKYRVIYSEISYPEEEEDDDY
jgi:hypothetical protein